VRLQTDSASASSKRGNLDNNNGRARYTQTLEWKSFEETDKRTISLEKKEVMQVKSSRCASACGSHPCQEKSLQLKSTIQTSLRLRNNLRSLKQKKTKKDTQLRRTLKRSPCLLLLKEVLLKRSKNEDGQHNTQRQTLILSSQEESSRASGLRCQKISA
jgi:hypothetical protein